MNLRLILILGLVSLLADWLYESVRAVVPQYLYYLGASAVFVGFVFGLGDALGYAARFITGPLADKRGGYWLETFLGYALQVAAVAGLVFAKDMWQVAGLIFLERFSKALRTPARDAIISAAGGAEARGRAFGIHASLDQMGAIIGVAMATAMLYYKFTPRDVFLISLAPGVAALFTLYVAYRVGKLKPEKRKSTILMDLTVFKFGATQFLLGLSLIHISLFMYKLAEVAWMASLLYLVAMVSEVPVSLLLGHFYDKNTKALLVAPLFSILLAAIFVAGNTPALFLGAVLYSVVTSYADVVAKAHAARLGGATSLGVINAMWGFGLLVGGILYGYFFDIGASIPIFILATASAFISLVLLWRENT